MSLFDLALHLKFTGAILIFLGVSHALFDKRFHWDEETAKMSPLNRQIFYVHNFFIALICAMMGALALLGTRALLEPTLAGNWLCGGLTLFWGCRLVFQFAVYDSQLWRGKIFETTIHYLFAAGWLYFTSVFAWAWWRQIW